MTRLPLVLTLCACLSAGIVAGSLLRPAQAQQPTATPPPVTYPCLPGQTNGLLYRTDRYDLIQVPDPDDGAKSITIRLNRANGEMHVLRHTKENNRFFWQFIE